MGHTNIVVTYNVLNMSCRACEQRIEKALSQLPGILNINASYQNEKVDIKFDPQKINEQLIIETLEKIKYPVNSKQYPDSFTKVKTWIYSILILGMIIVGYKILDQLGVFYLFPIVNNKTALPMLFVIGLFTSVHCIAMCGGINISQCASITITDKNATKQKILPSILYNSGRVVSYTLIGGIVGAIGSVLTPSGHFKGVVAIIAGIFMLIMGITMLGIFPFLRKFIPHMPKSFTRKINKDKITKTPFIIGLINGFMPCGPLQAMQFYALSTGSFFNGALSMFLFSIGTVPLMFGLGVLSSFLSLKFTKVMMKVSAILVILLAFMMLNNGLNLSGYSPLF